MAERKISISRFYTLKVCLSDSDLVIEFGQQGKDLIILAPHLKLGELASKYAYSFKISNVSHE